MTPDEKQKFDEFVAAVATNNGKFVKPYTEFKGEQKQVMLKCDVPEHPAFPCDYLRVVTNKGWCRLCYDAARKKNVEEEVEAALKAKLYTDIKIWWTEKNPAHKTPRSYLKWLAKCKNGHDRRGDATTARYLDGECRFCTGKYLTPEDAIARMHRIATENGGVCHSVVRDYKGNTSTMSFTCEDGHPFDPSFQDVSAGCFCPDWTCRQRKSARKKRQMRLYMHWKTGKALVATGAYEWGVVELMNVSQIEFEWQIAFQIPKSEPKVGGKIYILDMVAKLPGMAKAMNIEIKGWEGQNEVFSHKWSAFKKAKGEENCVMLLQQDLYDLGFYWKRKHSGGKGGLFNGFNHGTPEQTLMVKDENGVIQQWYIDLGTDTLKILDE